MNQPNVQTGTPVPPHVRPESVVDYDFYSDRRHNEVGDIHLALHRMAEEECRGIFWTPQNGGHWIVLTNPLCPAGAQRVRKASNAR